MSSSDSSPLHLPNLSIEGFRGIKRLWLPKLGRATLLTGRNGVGKTTVLEAVRIWAARGTSGSIGSILLNREEIASTVNGQIDQDDGTFIKTLFWGRNPNKQDNIVIGSKGSNDTELLKLTYIESFSKRTLDNRLKMNKISEHSPPMYYATLGRKFGGTNELMTWNLWSLANEPSDHDINSNMGEINFTWLNPRLSDTRTIIEFWNEFALTPNENLAVKALNVLTTKKIERIAVVGDRDAQKIIVKMEHADTPVPLRSLGDGATRVLAVAAAISCGQGGFLFIDEAEIGIHYTAQSSFWKMVLQAAYDNDVQVIATTHSFDCVKGFAEAAVGNKAVDGILVRIEEDDEAKRAITFDESELEVVARRGIEVR